MKIINLFIISMFCWCLSLNAGNNLEIFPNVPGCSIKATVTNVSCVINNEASNDGSITLEITGNTGTLTYKWTTNNGNGLVDGQKDQTGLSVGTYTFCVYDNGVQVHKESKTVTKPENFTIETETTDNICYNTEEGSIKITASGCAPPYNYSIDGGQTFFSSHLFENLKKGTYIILVKDAKGCEISKTVKIGGGEYLSIYHPESMTVENCLTQKAIDAKFEEWLKEFRFIGGTNPKEEGLDVIAPTICGGETIINYIVTDDCGTRRECNAIFTVPEKTALNFINVAQNQHITCNEDIDIELQVWLDSNANAIADSECPITWTNNFTECEWVTICGNTKFIEVTFTASNGCDKINTAAIFTIEDNEAPVFVEELPQDITVACNAIPEAVTLTANDNCSGNAEVSFDETTTNNDCGSSTVTRTWTAKDCSNNQTVHTQTITIEDNEAPVFVEELPQDITVACNAIPEAVTLTANENCSGNAEVSFDETTTNNDCGISTITRTWTAKDCSNNQTVHTQTITVEDNEAPVFVEELPQDITVACNAIPEAVTLTANDNCSGNAEVSFDETTTNNDCGISTVTRTWTVKDCSNNQTVHTQTITIEDNEAPILASSYEKDITITCGDIPTAPVLMFDDGCNTNLNVTFEELSNFTSEGEDYDIIRTWNVTDNCENEAVFTQNIHIRPQNITPIEPVELKLCIDDATFDLFELFPNNYTKEGTWEVASGNPSLMDNFFDPSKTAIGNYEITFVPSNNCIPPLIIQIIVHDDCVVLPCNSTNELVISKAITPNGDPYNEYFTVTGIEECGFTMTLQVFNRWGAEVFQSDNYQNNWNGYATSGIGVSSQIPAGTYFYILNILESGYDPIKGYIYVGTSSK
ncbi:gliding motility-associated C-terminal domain-containing protein [Galbibacter pacificus]|uniref:Gliding motility-associated C-terminal domain-containing protein n=1 Tax=Galbibacter pacificus TaxID=2996052 RepID=A0ABT6FUQ8_9FLAO|nr:gliding motility-associated C-terminal domain-containing protein [Galbibacter pacificus]MDG3583533.1 gliding motility-associated C-terminal domain-containing protein [Galbibacter pacificus]MDG3586991.1 gliding motility-associated C-terminal domain-containing protein [Galbibacter pacificus]